MNRLAFRALFTALGLLLLLSIPSIASADGGVTWDLVGVTLSGGGTASGSFVYNASTDTVSNVDITTSLGWTLWGADYTTVDPGFGPYASGIAFVTSSSSNLTLSPVLFLAFSNPLTNAGGTDYLSGGGEGLCFDGVCDAGLELRGITGGEVVSAAAVATPEPSSILLLGVGLALVAAFFVARGATRPLALSL